MRRIFLLAASLKTSAVLMVLVSILLLVNVAVPQESLVSQAGGRAGAPRWLASIGLTSVVTSRIFAIVLALFFLNLAAVLAKRLRPTIARLSKDAPSEESIAKWTAGARAISAPIPEHWSPAKVIEVLSGWGYRPRRVSEGTWWGVKHRWAPAGFILFHVSFFLILAGGVLIYATRFAAVARLVEGQSFDGNFASVLRDSPIAEAPEVRFHLESVEPRFDRGEPTELRAVIAHDPSSPREATRVNAPVSWGHESILVTEAGLAPVLWVQDANGYTIDRVTASSSLRQPTTLPLDGGQLTVTIVPKFRRSEFPMRSQLQNARFEVAVRGNRGELARGTLRRGEALMFDGGSVRLEDVRYWAGFLVVRERGGWLLVSGFVLAVVGITWRLMMHRRELVVHLDGPSVRLAGRADFFPDRFQDEMSRILAMMVVATEPRDGAEEEAGAA